MRRLLVAACAAAAVVLFAAPSSAGPIAPAHIVEVTKDVEGDVPDETSFRVEIDCDDGGEYALSFDEDGGTSSQDVGTATSCDVTEDDAGGATSVDVDGAPCTFTDPVAEAADPAAPVEPIVLQPLVCQVTVTNEFEPPAEVAPPEVIVVPGPVIEVPAAVPAPPRFTG